MDKRKEGKLQKLLDLGRKMAEGRMLEPLLEYALRVSLDLLQADFGYLALLDPGGGLDIGVRLDKDGQAPAMPEDKSVRQILKTVIEAGSAQVAEQAIADQPDAALAGRVEPQEPAWMCVPMISRGRTLGAIYIEKRSGGAGFVSDDLLALKYFAAQAAIAVENTGSSEDLDVRVKRRTAELNQKNLLLEKEIAERKKMEARLQHLAITDPLTGLYNRRHFFELSQRIFSRILGLDIPLSALMIDADHFKEVNDRYGHMIGDQVLQGLARRLREKLRRGEILGRYGGEEFAVLLPETGLMAARQVAERLRAEVSQRAIASDRGDIPLTVTIGAACVSETDERIDQLLDKADKALFIAKQAGRNQVAAWQQP
jgi:diguanylate cyclase (GGDEF)-like protein